MKTSFGSTNVGLQTCSECFGCAVGSERRPCCADVDQGTNFHRTYFVR